MALEQLIVTQQTIPQENIHTAPTLSGKTREETLTQNTPFELALSEVLSQRFRTPQIYTPQNPILQRNLDILKQTLYQNLVLYHNPDTENPETAIMPEGLVDPETRQLWQYAFYQIEELDKLITQRNEQANKHNSTISEHNQQIERKKLSALEKVGKLQNALQHNDSDNINKSLNQLNRALKSQNLEPIKEPNSTKEIPTLREELTEQFEAKKQTPAQTETFKKNEIQTGLDNLAATCQSLGIQIEPFGTYMPSENPELIPNQTTIPEYDFTIDVTTEFSSAISRYETKKSQIETLIKRRKRNQAIEKGFKIGAAAIGIVALAAIGTLAHNELSRAPITTTNSSQEPKFKKRSLEEYMTQDWQVSAINDIYKEATATPIYFDGSRGSQQRLPLLPNMTGYFPTYSWIVDSKTKKLQLCKIEKPFNPDSETTQTLKPRITTVPKEEIEHIISEITKRLELSSMLTANYSSVFAAYDQFTNSLIVSGNPVTPGQIIPQIGHQRQDSTIYRLKKIENPTLLHENLETEYEQFLPNIVLEGTYDTSFWNLNKTTGKINQINLERRSSNFGQIRQLTKFLYQMIFGENPRPVKDFNYIQISQRQQF